MFVKLTNATPAHKGKGLAINLNSIVTMHNDKIERQLDENTTYFEDVTYLFCPPHGTWEVQESIDEVITIINKARK
jgi:glyoxylate utilization-related uncharacterized protein